MMGHRLFSDENLWLSPEPSDAEAGGALALESLRFDPLDRCLRGPAGETRLEPRVAQLLVVLAGRRGEVVRRDELQQAIWPGIVVGEDSLNRLVAALRRALRQVGSGGADRIETISKSGYRLALDLETPTRERFGAPRLTISRRAGLALAGGMAIAGAAGLWGLAIRKAPDPRVARLLEQARVAQGAGLAESDASSIGFLNEALALDPDNAAAWGLLALAHYKTLDGGAVDETRGTAECELAGRRALALDPGESNARAALAILPPIYGDWLAAQRRYDAILEDDPDNLAVITEKGLLMMSVGRCQDALALAERAVELSPFAPVLHYHRAFRLWAVGELFEMDRAIDRAGQLWPSHPGIRYARFLTFAGSGREAAALRMLDQPQARAPLPPPLAGTWRALLEARIGNDGNLRGETVQILLRQASEHTAAAVNAILGLGLLGARDEAFQVAQGYLLRRGPNVGNLRTPGPVAASEQRSRKTMMLFTPPSAPLRADARFAGLVEDMGLAQYWRRSGKAPDYQLA